MDANVQVALVSVFATTITTMGVIAAAMINNRKERGKAADAGVDAGLNDSDVLKLVGDLIAENSRKESSIVRLREQVEALETENEKLKEEIEEYKAKNPPEENPNA